MKNINHLEEIQVVIVEDDTQIRESLSVLIESSEGFRCETTYPDCETAFEGMVDPPHAVLMDIQLPGKSGIEGVRELKKRFPNTEFVMLTVSENNQDVFDSLCAGASGYLRKNTPPRKILQSIDEAISGGSPMNMEIARLVVSSFQKSSSDFNLTEREQEILEKLCEGHSYKMIAADLYININTVKFHIKNIYGKLHVNSKGEAISKAMRENLT